jgi:hypothetical protein
MLVATDPTIAPLLVLIEDDNDRDLTDEENLRLEYYYLTLFRQFEDLYRSVEAGTIPEGALRNIGTREGSGWDTNFFKETWRDTISIRVDEEFADWFELQFPYLQS